MRDWSYEKEKLFQLAQLCLKEAVNYYLADFFPLRGGGPPIPLSFFGQNDFPLRVGGTVGEEAM